MALSRRSVLFNEEIFHLRFEHPAHELALRGRNVAVQGEGDDVKIGVFGAAYIGS